MKAGFTFAVLMATFWALGAGERGDVLIADVPQVKQKPGFSGEACVEMWLRKLGGKATQDTVFDLSGVDPLLGRGCNVEELAAALEKMGFRAAGVAAGDGAGEAPWPKLYDDLLNGVPSVVPIDGAPGRFWLVLGYSRAAGEVIYRDPAADQAAYKRIKKEAFERGWLGAGGAPHRLVRIRLQAADLKEPERAAGFANADYAQHVMQLKPRVPEGFAIVLQRPFIVVGDEPAQVLKLRAERTVKWAVDLLKKEYFEKDPEEILDIWLFKDKESYEKHTKELFGEKPTSPFGYYSAANRALIMNIATGGGTLVHEIVHPFMRANFPECPAWFNEGLASLYEQCGERDGRIRGETNWRLAGLQKAIRARGLSSFERLSATTSNEFYDEDKGTNYSQARYLCYYLQEKGLLRRFYAEFRAKCKEDRTGYRTLKQVLGGEDMGEFEKEWQAFVLRLEFP